jgi:hypothetical protein
MSNRQKEKPLFLQKVFSLFNRMADSYLLKEFIKAVLEDREQDFWKIEMANKSFDSILNYIKSLRKDIKQFERVFDKNQGWFNGFALGTRIRKEEHLKLRIQFQERTLYGIKGKINAQAVRVRMQPENPKNAQLKGFIINIFFNAPSEVIVDPKNYNRWFAANLENILSDPSIKSSYVHEFTHVLDFKRMDPHFLLKRGLEKQKQVDALKTSGGKRDFGKYANDPLELNAYFSQAISDIRSMLKHAQTEEEKQEILGTTPQEFTEKFMQKYLKKQVRKNISPDNHQRLMKRAATAWEFLIKEPINQNV